MNRVFLVCSFFIGSLIAQTPVTSYINDQEGHQRNANIDVTHMLLNVQFEPTIGKVIGEVEHTFIGLQSTIDTIFLDGPNIQVSEALCNDIKIQFSQTKTGIIFYPKLLNAFSKTYKLKIRYTATPKKGIYFIGWNLPPRTDLANQSRNQIWTQGQGIDHRNWIPMIDDRGDKFITEVKVTFQKEYNVLSNGDLIAKKQVGNNTEWHYKMRQPHAGYLLMLAIDKYAIKETKTKTGVPIEFWYYPEEPQKVEPTSKYTEKIIEFLETETGFSYPWGKYAQAMVQDFMYGAMENTTATIFGDFFWVDSRAFLDRNYVMVNCHEATHQWFGDLITARHDGEHWLQESFATFYPGLFEAEVGTKQDMEWYFRSNMDRALGAGKENDYPVAHSQGGTARHYPKGASVLYMLHHIIGKENFNRGIKHYLQKNAFKGVETVDLQRGFMDATGINVDWFLDQWIKRGGEPTFNVTTKDSANFTIVNIAQTQKITQTVGLFTVPVDMAFYYPNGQKIRKTIQVSKANETFLFTNLNNTKPIFTLFDEGSFILKNVNFTKSTEELLLQAQNAEFALDRFDALVALRKVQYEIKKALFNKLLLTEKVDKIIAEIASQSVSNSKVVKMAIAHPSSVVRAKMVETLTPTAENKNYLMLLTKDASYATTCTAMDKFMQTGASKSEIQTTLNFVQNTLGQNHNVRLKYLQHAYNQADNKQLVTDKIANYTSAMYEFRTRANAFEVVKANKIIDKNTFFNILEAMLSYNNRLSGPAENVLKTLAKEPNFTAVLSQSFNQLSQPNQLILKETVTKYGL